QGELPRRLSPQPAEAVDVAAIDEAKFDADMAADPMATEKLATGIEAFAKDLLTLRQNIAARLA
ncbi:MAG: transaldolase, partial [Stenotrophomonas nitritireducens]